MMPLLRVALTGGIATGKSHVLARLRAAGIPTIDADALVHDALAPGSPTIASIVERFGPGVLSPDGAIDRARLGAMVFRDAAARRDLEALLHPEVYRRIDEWFVALTTPLSESDVRTSGRSDFRTADFAVADIPLLYETHHERLFDRVIVVACPAEMQLARLRERNGLPEEAARQRLAAQWPIAEKVRRADLVIDTSGSFEETDKQADDVIARLRQP